MEAAAILGAVGGNPDKGLAVLEEIKPEHIGQMEQLLEQGICQCKLKEGVPNLYILVRILSDEHSAEVEIRDKHTNVTRIKKDGAIVFEKSKEQSKKIINTQALMSSDDSDTGFLSIAEIIEFANALEVADVKEILDRQIQYNGAIAEEGLKNTYGAGIGKTLMKHYPDDLKVKARAIAAAGSDARMSGCSLPVVINSGSGNQGMTVSLPVIMFAKEWNVSDDRLYRALAISNLTAIHQKEYIGDLSAYCGAVCAACGAGAAITYMAGGSYNNICGTITNTLANVGGIVCDGAKASCAAKISSSVEAAIMAHYMSMEENTFQSGDGLVKEDIEQTIASVGRVGREGMKETDLEILRIMMD
jgi:L-cysteine desulfidase